MKREVFLLGLAATAGACAPVARIRKTSLCPTAGATTASRLYAMSIVGGEPVPDNDRHGQSTVGLLLPTMNNGNLERVFVCSAVVVSEDLLLTAAHCLKYVSQATEANPATRIQIHFSSSIPGSPTREASAFLRNPDYTGSGLSDIGWIKFSGGLPPGFTPVRVLTDTSRLTKGLAAQIVGYGALGTQLTATIGQRRLATTFVEELVNRTVGGVPFSNLVRVVDKDPGTGFRRQTGACFGDSGGPLFVNTASTMASLKVAGLTQGSIQGINATPASRSESCETGDANYTLVAPFLPWIRQTAGVDLDPPRGESRIQLFGLPEAQSGESQLNVLLSGSGDAASYRYAVVAGGEDCAKANYSPTRSLAQPISETLPSVGPRRLCVVGRDVEDKDLPTLQHDWNYQVAYAGKMQNSSSNAMERVTSSRENSPAAGGTTATACP